MGRQHGGAVPATEIQLDDPIRLVLCFSSVELRQPKLAASSQDPCNPHAGMDLPVRTSILKFAS
jgi:hypothetical protein